ncbi:V-set and transmembrane domain-containing protein 2-like protein [Scleropages formosus]|uniref:V-set and transmembrane domain-containing protein 2-like protein n=1 Tax=Scleropages formosus TaxID=113540 RepID=A0A8C9V6Y1_SCLFO|nr:V-set and transmembrane domain-containing protein 2-like protein [Scleropages formosus]
MGAFGALVGILHCMGLYVQLSASSRQGGHGEVENRISGNAFFTEVPHDIKTQSGQDVEMACSFRGAGSPSYSLEIQWWYIRNREWTDKQAWMTNEVVAQDEMITDATKISVVKVAGSNISHKLRLSSVKPSDEGTYECRVIDFSDSKAQHHRVRAYLQIESDQSSALRAQTANFGAHPSEHTQHRPSHSHQKGDRKLREPSAGNPTDCTDGCVL